MEHWDNVFEEVPASFEDRIVSTLASLEEKPKIRRFRMPAGSLIASTPVLSPSKPPLRWSTSLRSDTYSGSQVL